MSLQPTDTKPLFMRGPSLGVRMLLIAVFSILLMILDHQQGHLRTVRQGLAVAVYPIRVVVDLPFTAASWMGESLSDRGRLLSENRVLRTDILIHQARLQRMATLEAENARLRALMDSSAQVSNRVVVAEILEVDLDPYRHRVAIDKSNRHDVFEGQAMIDARGVVGQVTRVDLLSAEAILISDPGHALPVEVNRNGLRTIALGTGDTSRIDLPFLPNSADIEPGDLLVSSGLGGAFPAGYPVARVMEVDRDPGRAFARIRAEPTASLNKEREVLLVWPRLTPVEAPMGTTVQGDPEASPPDPGGEG